MTAETSNARGEWVLVPRELTQGMRSALARAVNASCNTDEWYAHTLAASPPPADAEVRARELLAALPDVGLNGWFDGVRVLARVIEHLTDAQQGQAVAECHCATCTCAPGMTPAVRFDTSPAAQEGAVRDHLIALGWTPPGAQQPAAVDGAYPTPRNRAEAAALARLALAHLGVIDAHIDAAIARCETNSAAKHQEPKP